MITRPSVIRTPDDIVAVAETEIKRRCLACGDRPADWIVGIRNLPLCHPCWDAYAGAVLIRRSIEEEEKLR